MTTSVANDFLANFPASAQEKIERLCRDFPGKIIVRHSTKTKSRIGVFSVSKKSVGGVLAFNFKIRINGPLSPEFFLFTFLHEYAHYLNFVENYPRRLLPHGIEWKMRFKNLLEDFLDDFSEPVRQSVIQFKENPRATASDKCIVAQHFLEKSKPRVSVLDKLDPGDSFWFKNKKYTLLHKRRTRYLAVSADTGREYSFSTFAPISPIGQQTT